MARIRSIKPETFDDPDLNHLPFAARWFFVGLWTQADKCGKLVEESRRLKARLLPYDAVDAEELLALLTPKFIRRYEVGGVKYIQINNFARHQRPHPHEPASTYPDIPPTTNGRRATTKVSRRRVDPCLLSLGTGEGKGREEGTDPAPEAPSPPAVLQKLWNEGTTPPLPRSVELSKEVAAKARLRLHWHDPPWWATVIARIEASAFCRGQNERGWRADFGWLVANESNALKVLEGKYDNRAAASTSPVDAAVERVRHLIDARRRGE